MIRKARFKDIDELLEIEQLSWVERPWQRADFNRYIHSRRNKLFVWENSTGVCGFIAVEKVNKYRDMDIINLSVHPSCWRRGIGESLVRHVINYAGPRLEALVRAEDDALYQLFQKCGFGVLETERMPDGQVVIAMGRAKT